MMELFVIILILVPFALAIWNIVTFVIFLKKKQEKANDRIIELVAMGIGFAYLLLYLELMEILFVGFDVQLYYGQKHSIIAPEYFTTILIIMLVSLLGYVLIRFIPVEKQSPVVTAFGIAANYLGMGLCIVWCIQTIQDWRLIFLPTNCIVIFFKTICITVYRKNTLIQTKQVSIKFTRLSDILNKATNLPWLALLLVIPLLGMIVAVLFLFGQEPDSMIKSWTQTADWTFSQKIAPPSIPYDGHYLCTVAAGGHRKIVKPQRLGIRHGHTVLVNRQLCIANAFEQVLEERTPLIHKVVRGVYDNTGYPISKYIRSRYVADIIYYIMKPFEWFFLLVLYTVDVNPENRIAIQYPHRPIKPD